MLLFLGVWLLLSFNFTDVCLALGNNISLASTYFHEFASMQFSDLQCSEEYNFISFFLSFADFEKSFSLVRMVPTKLILFAANFCEVCNRIGYRL